MLSSPVPFREALRRLAQARLLPTNMGSAELSELAADIRERAFFSARTTNEHYLGVVKRTIEDILNPFTGAREDGSPVTEGLDLASARLRLKDTLDLIGYQPDPAERGTIKDLSSDGRLNLVLQTNTQMAQGYGNWRQGQDPAVLDAFPAQELFRAEEREEPRDWITRWRGAGGQLVGGGRMIALKTDPIWTEISAFGTPYPPFDFNSGMDVRDIDRAEAVELGLIGENDQLTPDTRPFERDIAA